MDEYERDGFGVDAATVRYPVDVFDRPVETEMIGPVRPETSADLTADRLLRRRSEPPTRGWRRAVWEVTGRRVRAPETRGERHRRELRARAELPVATGHHRVAVMSLKGGVGKTTTTMVLGATLADVRGDRVIAVDANPDRGTLAERLRLETSATVRDLLTERDQIQRYADVRAFTSQASSRLEVLASDRDPAVSEAFSARDYATVAGVLERFYSIALTDCGTGLLHSAMSGVLGLADQLVIVSSPAVDGARSASATLDWLEAHGYAELVAGAVVVLTAVRRIRSGPVDVASITRHFNTRCRDVVHVPYDPHLDEGSAIDLLQLSPATADAYLGLAAAIADRFPGT
jgi:MinD-like ATPase involved in chromosome partitioning or flagellar assembly